MIIRIRSSKEMDDFAAAVLKKLQDPQLGGFTAKLGRATVLALSGELGSGKTAFVKSLAKALGVKRIIQSPTFVILKSYKLKAKSWKLLIHIDAYRIEENRELEILGWKDLIKDPKNLIAIEWPERVKKLIPKSAIKLNFKFVDEDTRKVEVEL